MISVRFPTGLCVQYREAHFVEWTETAATLYTDQTKNVWVASIMNSSGAIIKARLAWHVMQQIDSADQAVDYLLKNLSDVRSSKRNLSRLKKKLDAFDGRTHDWRPE